MPWMLACHPGWRGPQAEATTRRTKTRPAAPAVVARVVAEGKAEAEDEAKLWSTTTTKRMTQARPPRKENENVEAVGASGARIFAWGVRQLRGHTQPAVCEQTGGSPWAVARARGRRCLRVCICQG
mmetsp:Transcript_21783/g.70438  ORF Transcript_21783/g.70438 Transcript_21783/m.70438 type:complete len:126 (-) Transcript_21783:185-562(-)